MFRQLAGASALALILAGGAVAQDHDHDHDHDHGDVTLYRVFVGDHEKGQVTAFDLSEPDHRWTFPTTGQVKLFPVAGGAVVAAVQSDADTVQFIRSGISFHDHGDHRDIEVGDPAAIDASLTGPRPFHLVEHDGKVVLNYDQGGYAEILEGGALAEGKVDAVTGFSFSVFLNLTRLGVPAEDISVFLMADHGVAYYGNAIIVNTDYAAANPERVTGFLRATARGWQDAINDPEAAVRQMITRTPASDVALETERLNIALAGNVLTDAVRANGMGRVDPDRFARSIEQLKEIYDFVNDPTPELYYTDAYLPDDGSLTLN